MSERKTVHVRIAVAVDPDGDWSCCGWSSGDDATKRDLARDTVGEGEATYWLEADLPIPEQQTFKASVSGEVSS